MARKPPNKSHADETVDDVLTEPSAIDPYNVLAIEKTASQEQIKSAYRKAALRHHPDKSKSEDRDEANEKFQEIAFAYAILSDERRRRRYDTTGNTAETLNVDDDDFDWTEYFREQTAAMVDGAMIETIKKEYQGSEEEKDDVLRAYTEYEGNMDAVYEQIMCSNVLEDDKRLRGYIDGAIKAGEVESYRTYTKESKDKKRRRLERAKGEEDEAMALAEELGVKEKLFGASKGGGSNKKKKRASGGGGDDDDGQDALKALIQQRQQSRSEGFLDRLEAKYGGGNPRKKSKRPIEEPSEEMFAANAKKSKTTK